MYHEEHALFIFSVLEKTVISEENKRVKETCLNLKPTFFFPKASLFPKVIYTPTSSSFGDLVLSHIDLVGQDIKNFQSLVIKKKGPLLFCKTLFLPEQGFL